MLSQILRNHPANQVAVVYQDQYKTYKDLDELSNRVALMLFDIGIKKSDKIALFMHNSLEMVICYFAIFKIGATAVPINVRFKSPELAYVLKHVDASLLIIEDALFALFKEIEFSFLNLKTGSFSTFFDLKLSNTIQPFLPIIKEKETDLACILYTSGTTSRPKGVMHTHSSLLNTAINQSLTLKLDSSSTVLIFLSICHIAGFAGQILTTLYAGGQIILLSQFEPEDVLKAIKKYQVTQLMMLPVHIAQLMQHPLRDYLCAIKQCIVGGDKIPKSIHQSFYQLTEKYLIECCGMTESFTYAANYPSSAEHIGSIGKPVHATELKIVDAQDNVLKAGNTGEIIVKSLANSIGYWNDPEATEALFKKNYLYTGDLAYQDENGYFWFNGRKKEIIIRGGSNISPAEVEEALYQHPAVKEVGVIGFPDPNFGQVVHACIVLKDGQSATEAELKEFSSRYLADYKIPEKILFKQFLPHNDLGKLDRKKL